ncbi:MAG: DUF2064 domain-containing protein [Methylophilaceae bacterium]|nr:DUF2064 domain-containing protein [Methylophilaceae bacterium]
MNKTALVLMCKRPALGVGKQRIAAALGQEVALKIAQALLDCTLEEVFAWAGAVVIAPASAHDADWADTLGKQHGDARLNVSVLPQIDGNLGQRINALDSTLRNRGFNQLIFIGSDAPTLNTQDFIESIALLLINDTVLKPTLDGGVSLMASRKSWPDLTDLPWSTSELGDELALQCKQDGHTTVMLASGFDVDEVDDLALVLSALKDDKRPARRALYQLTAQVTRTMEAHRA